jgi:uncharacterized membrane protein YdfJ with MMPL/SSD domain
MFSALGRFIIKRSPWLLALGVAIIVGGATYGTGVFNYLGSQGFDDPNSESAKAQQIINDQFGDQFGTLLVHFSSNDNLKVDDPEYQQAVISALEPIHSNPKVKTVIDYYGTGNPAFKSFDSKQTYAVVQVEGNDDEASDTISTLRTQVHSDRLTVNTGGVAAINEDFQDQIQKDLARAETISFIFLTILLIVVFRSLVAAALPLLLGAMGVLGAFLIVRLITNVMDVSQYAINVITLLGLGLAIDYSLFVVNRFREELRGGRSPKEALQRTIETAGRTVFFSGFTVILSLLGLLIFPINFLQSMGVGGAAAVAVAMLSALTVLPAILYLLGHRVNWLSFGNVRSEYQAAQAGKAIKHTEKRSIWYRIAGWATQRPILSILLIVIPLALISQIFLQAKFSSPDYRSLPDGSSSKVVAEALKNNFPGGGNGNPIQVLVHLPAGSTPESTAALTSTLMKDQIQPLSGVTQSRVANANKDYVLIEVGYNSEYDEPLARDLVQNLRDQAAPAGTEMWVGGTTAQLVDLLSALTHFAPYAGLLVAIALTVLLFLMLGSVMVPLQAIFVNLLSLSATFGILVWIFQEGHLEKLLGFTSVGSIDATQPVLIFCIAFGLSMDYAVFLLSRVKEEYDHSNQVVDSVKEGVQKTGSIITSAAVLLIVVVGAFATSSIPLIKQIGVGLALAVFIDAFIVRMLLVPAMMSLFGRANWWAPSWLRSLSERSGLGEKS